MNNYFILFLKLSLPPLGESGKLYLREMIIMDENLIKLGFALAEATAKNSISYVNSKMKLAKEKKDLQSQSLAYTEIINNLLEDKEELANIAREYKQAYEQITISDKDIEYLQNTLKQALELLISFSPNTVENEKAAQALISLLNKDTLKTMQLLGFNYNEAIGKPLTEVCSETIKTKLGPKTKNTIKKHK